MGNPPAATRRLRCPRCGEADVPGLLELHITARAALASLTNGHVEHASKLLKIVADGSRHYGACCERQEPPAAA